MMAPKTISINLNMQARFKIPPRGVELYERYYAEVGLKAPPLKPDADGFLTMQLWELAGVFGPGMTMGFDPPIDPDVEIIARL